LHPAIDFSAGSGLEKKDARRRQRLDVPGEIYMWGPGLSTYLKGILPAKRLHEQRKLTGKRATFLPACV
jgi:hypothetical protein